MSETLYWSIDLENYNDFYALIQKVTLSLLNLNVTLWTKILLLKIL